MSDVTSADLMAIERLLHAGMQSAVPDELRIHFMQEAWEKVHDLRLRATPA